MLNKRISCPSTDDGLCAHPEGKCRVPCRGLLPPKTTPKAHIVITPKGAPPNRCGIHYTAKEMPDCDVCRFVEKRNANRDLPPEAYLGEKL